jgi:hypothetical protein
MVVLPVRQLQPKPMPEVKNYNCSEYRNDYPRGMESASCAGWGKQVRYGPADYRADNAEDNCPRNCQMGMQKRLGHAAREKTDNNIPDEMEHISSY